MMAPPRNPVTSLRLAWLLPPLLALACLLAACEQGAQEETIVFQEAEALYRAGDYDSATERYESFLEAYPRSPFARTARLRLRTIDREVESVMGTRGTNRPIFLRPSAEETEAILQQVRDQEAPQLPRPEPASAQDEEADPEDAPRQPTPPPPDAPEPASTPTPP